MNQIKTEAFLRHEALKVLETASKSESLYEKLRGVFESVKNTTNWKESTSVEIRDLTGLAGAMDRMIQSTVEYIAAFAFFTGGVEIQVYSDNHFKISTKGYYHYIGA